MKSKHFLGTFACISILVVFMLALYGLIGASASFAQSTGGRIRGTVTDSTGGAILSRLPDNSLLASGHNAGTDTYTVKATINPKDVSEIRLEALTRHVLEVAHI